MKKKSFVNVFVTFLSCVVLFSSCVSSTLIQSSPPGAKVYINGESVGKTPYLYSDSKIVGSITNIDLVKDGYNTLYTSLERTEQANPGAIVGGLICAVPFLWMLEYKPLHTYELTPLEPEAISQTEKIIETKEPVAILQNKPVESATVSATKDCAKKPVTKIERLKELKELLDANLITKEDFEIQKKRILSEI